MSWNGKCLTEWSRSWWDLHQILSLMCLWGDAGCERRVTWEAMLSWWRTGEKCREIVYVSSHVYLQHKLTTGYIWTVRYFRAKGFAFQQANNFQISPIPFDMILSPISISNIRKLSRKLQTKLQVNLSWEKYFPAFDLTALHCFSVDLRLWTAKQVKKFFLASRTVYYSSPNWSLLSAWVGQQNTSQL